MDPQTVSYYNQHAIAQAELYESASSSLLGIVRVLASNGTDGPLRLLDIGCGSGRDLAEYLRLGIDALGFDASAEMIAEAQRRHPELKERLFVGTLPGALPPPVRRPAFFEIITLSAVLMHVPEAELFDAALALRDLLAPAGALVIAVPTRRADTDPTTERDTRGRLMRLRSVDEISLLFERIGFARESVYHSADALGRDAEWSTLVLRQTATQTRSIDRIESIINRDRKTATYKLALLHALCEIALTNYRLGQFEADGTVSVALNEVAERWLISYWPIVASSNKIPQTSGDSGRKPMAFRRSLRELADYYGKAATTAAPLIQDRSRGFRDPAVRTLYNGALKKIGDTILKGPVTYAGGAREEQVFSFDAATRRIRFDAEIWREFVLMGHWIRDSLRLRWAEFTSRLAKGEISTAHVLELLLLPVESARQDPAAREIYQVQPNLECVWSGKSLKNTFDVDHAIPFALAQTSALWNLFPASKACNNEKSDRLPELSLLGRRKEAIIHDWRLLNGQLPIRFGNECARLLGRPDLPHDWELPLFDAFKSEIETTAALRGVPRWVCSKQ